MVIQLDELKKAKRREYVRQYRKDNLSKRREYEKEWAKKYRARNREKYNEQARERYHKDIENINKRRKVYRKNNMKKLVERNRVYISNNREKVRETKRLHIRRKLAEDATFKLVHQYRTRMGNALRCLSLPKKQRTVKLLGCKPFEFKQWLESHFTEGMSWENQGEWHVDHTLPIMPVLKKFGEAALPIVSNYRNCKPMWAKENREKHASIPAVKEIHPWVGKQLVALAKSCVSEG